MTSTGSLAVRKLRPSDLGRLSTVGLRTRKLRAGLSALGIAIGVAAIVAVLGLSSSSQAGLLNEISKLGTNLLVVESGQTFTGGTAELPEIAPAMIARIGPVTDVEDTGTVNVDAYRNPLIPSIDTNALTVDAASLGLLTAVGTTVAQGSYLNAATAREPVCVLGAAAAQRLGIDRVYSGERIWADNMWLYVAGILNPAVLAPDIDSSVLVGFPAAEHYLGFDGHPSTVYVRAQNSHVNQVDNLLAATANPENPSEVDVSQPSAALVAPSARRSPISERRSRTPMIMMFATPTAPTRRATAPRPRKRPLSALLASAWATSADDGWLTLTPLGFSGLAVAASRLSTALT